MHVVRMSRKHAWLWPDHRVVSCSQTLTPRKGEGEESGRVLYMYMYIVYLLI